jgi:hypothetical protein
MLNDKRVCQLMLPTFIIFNLARDCTHKHSLAVIRYVSKHFSILLNHDHKRMHKLTVRMAKRVKEIEVMASNNGMVSGKKMVAVAFFLTQLIFDEKDGKLTDEYANIAKITARLIEFNTKFFEKNIPEEDQDKILKSAEKLAKKVFETIYKEL